MQHMFFYSITKTGMIVFFSSFLAILYYMMAAEAGIEVGTFNLAWLCDENKVNKVFFH